MHIVGPLLLGRVVRYDDSECILATTCAACKSKLRTAGSRWDGKLWAPVGARPPPSARRRAIRLPDDQLKAGPDLVHGADLDVHQAERQRERPDGVLGDVGGHP